jgi:predicted O-methyltransferase YrrM
MSVLHDPKLESLLATLHARSDEQLAALRTYDTERASETKPAADEAAQLKAFRSDKLVALDRDKAEFCYMICRAIGARRIVEAGTSFGVSTLYLAAAVRDNGGGTVFAAECESAKVERARANYEAAGLASFIDLREADIFEAIKTFEGPIDFVLFDIWGDVGPMLDSLLPRLRPGAVLCADNTGGSRTGGYAAMFKLIDDPANGFRTMTLPFQGGFELTVKL